MKTIQEQFVTLFGTEGEFYRSAGRVNIIGEHTDYNGGYVLPGAIDKGITLEIEINNLDKCRVCALDYEEYVEFCLDDEKMPEPQWAWYIYGVCNELRKRGVKVGNFNAVFTGDIPPGAGLSSSAALETVFAYALNDLFKGNLELLELAKIGQIAEHDYCNVKCGIMDQFSSCFGKKGSLIMLNCRTLEYKYYPFNPEGYKLVLLNTCVKHELATSEYNNRRASCEAVVKAIQVRHPQVEFLSEVSVEWLDEVKEEISAEDYAKAEFIIGECRRVKEVGEALEKADYVRVGELMYETHDGLSRLFEVSCAELDFLNNVAKECGVTGSRMMGGGFGGCTLNLVKEELYDNFIKKAVLSFTKQYGKAPKIYDVVIGDGVRKLS